MEQFNQLYKELLGEEHNEDMSAQLDTKTGEAEDWKPWMTRNIVKSGSDFLRKVYELGYTGEAGDSDVNEIVDQLCREVEADDRVRTAIDAVVTHMVNAGHADF